MNGVITCQIGRTIINVLLQTGNKIELQIQMLITYVNISEYHVVKQSCLILYFTGIRSKTVHYHINTRALSDNLLPRSDLRWPSPSVCAALQVQYL